MATKGASDRYRSCMFVVSSFDENKTRVAERFNALVADGSVATELPIPDVEALLTFLGLELERLGKVMIAADQAYLDEVSDDPGYREARDEARNALADKYLRQRDIFTGTFGKVAAREVGFEANVERDGGRLVFQVQRIVDKLTSGYELPVSDMQGVEITPTKFAEDFDPEYTNLSEAQDDLLRELREADTKLIAKRASIEAFDGWFLATTRSGVALYTLVGMDEEARRIRPSLRRPGRRAAEVEGEEEPPASDPPAGDAAAGDPADRESAAEPATADSPTAPATAPEVSPAASSGEPERTP